MNESVFRYLLVRQLLNLNPPFTVDDEWKRIDLFLQAKDSQAAIEIKFYDSRPLNPISGKVTYKGGAGQKNWSEFNNSLRGLLNLRDQPWHEKQFANIKNLYFILIGTKREELGYKGDFMEWYYPTNRMNVDFCSVHEVVSKTSRIDGMTVFGWLCKVIPHHRELTDQRKTWR